jgi:hypothetical protein
MEYNSMSIVHRAYDNNTVLLATDKILFGLIMPISFANILLLFVLVPFVFIDRQRFHRNILLVIKTGILLQISKTCPIPVYSVI